MEKVSIITPAFNSEKTILRTLESIQKQTYKNFEHLIVDGGSKDKTLDVLRNNSSQGVKVFSEPDKGIYDAMNKGVALADGDIIAILNSDDYYIDEDVLGDVVGLFAKGADIVYGGIVYCRSNGELTFAWVPNEFKSGDFSRGWHTPHPAFFIRKSLYDLKGLFNKTYKIAADFDLMLRMLDDTSVISMRLPRPLVVMQNDGTSSKLKNVFKGMWEILDSLNKNGVRVNFAMYIAARYFPKILRRFRN